MPETRSDSRLFQPLKLGQLTLSHRAILAPLTRFRADKSHVVLPFVKTYYAQRASEPGTLLITEGTIPTPRSGIYPGVPGLWSKEQVAGWKEVTDAVHAKGSYIFTQLWPIGRVADLEATKAAGYENVPAPSPIAASDHGVPHELTIPEIKAFVDETVQAAKNAIEAGFDGVEVHSANGYLLDQFIQDVSNNRTDEYGGSIENRARLVIEVTTAVAKAIGSDKVGVRFSPFSPFQDMKMADPYPQFTYAISELKKLNLAYLHLVESRVSGNSDAEGTEKVDPLIAAWEQGDGKTTAPVLLAGGFKHENAFRTVDEEFPNKNIAVVFGRYWLSTPDLPFRLRHGIEFNAYDRDLFYNAGEERGYTDWPFSKEFEAQQKSVKSQA